MGNLIKINGFGRLLTWDGLGQMACRACQRLDSRSRQRGDSFHDGGALTAVWSI